MDKYGRVLIFIFFLCLINLGLSFFAISKLNSLSEVKPTPIALTKSIPSPLSSGKPIATTSDPEAKPDLTLIKSDLTLIKAEIRALREILGTTKSFEELSNLIKTLENN